MAGQTFGTCSLTASEDTKPLHPQTLAIAQDYEGYSASLSTAPTFGCVQFQARPNQTGPTRSGVVVVFFLVWCCAMIGGTLLGMRTPRTVAAVEQRWHGPAHEHPADYARDYAGSR